MRISGERIKRTRLIQTERYVVAVDVEMVIPADDPSEPCYEAETVKFLQEVKEARRARRIELVETAWQGLHGGWCGLSDRRLTRRCSWAGG